MFLVTAVGLISSTTVTTASEDDELPVLSLTVKVTVFSPLLEQLNVDLLIEIVVVQLSVLPLLMSLAVKVAIPFSFK